jgi:cold shock CspA family protein
MDTMQRSGKVGRPKDPVGTPAVGRIARLQIGQSHGFIRVRNSREVFFHRADLAEDTAFNTLQIGDVVSFHLIEDAVSGARATRVIRRGPARP